VAVRHTDSLQPMQTLSQGAGRQRLQGHGSAKAGTSGDLGNESRRKGIRSVWSEGAAAWAGGGGGGETPLDACDVKPKLEKLTAEKDRDRAGE